MAKRALAGPGRRTRAKVFSLKQLTAWSKPPLLYGTLVLLGSLYILPFIWMISTSLKDDPQVYRIPLTWIPNPWRLQNYVEAMTQFPWHLFFLNSAKYATLTVLGTLLSCSLCAYGFGRMRWPGRDALFFLVLATTMIPYSVQLIPLYLIFNRLKWLNTYAPLIVPTFFGSPYYIFLLRQFFLTIPAELTDAARIDGASELVMLTRIILPLAKPALATTALFEFMATWNDYMGPVIYLKDWDKYPVAVGLAVMRNRYASNPLPLVWPHLMAASAVTIAPVLALFFFTQRTFVEGISLTGIKG